MSRIFTIGILLFISNLSKAQNPSAVFELEATDQGILIPRTDTATVNAAHPTPATGLFIFQNSDATFYVYDGTKWKSIGNGGETFDLSHTSNNTDRTISISGGGAATTINVADNDNDGTNEIQDLKSVLEQNNEAAFNRIRNVGAPVEQHDAATKVYVDDRATPWQDLSNFIRYGSAVKLGQGDPKATLQVGENQDVLFGNDTIGGGMKLVWNGARAALRGGYLSTEPNHWNPDSLGLYSTAFGEDNLASEQGTMAWGRLNTATGTLATAWGNDNQATGEEATSWGANNRAFGPKSTAWGTNNTASGVESTAWGLENNATGLGNTAWGIQNETGRNFSTVWGRGNKALTSETTVFGRNNIASQFRSTAFGMNNRASGHMSTVWGGDNVASSEYETVLGRFATIPSSPSPNQWVESDRLFAIGNGSFHGRNDALAVYKNGIVEIDSSLLVSLIDITKDGSLPELVFTRADDIRSGPLDNLGRISFKGTIDNGGTPLLKTGAFIEANQTDEWSCVDGRDAGTELSFYVQSPKTSSGCNQVNSLLNPVLSLRHNLATINVPTSLSNISGNTTISGYTQLGSDAPAIKIKKLSGVLSSDPNGAISIPFDVSDHFKIISINVLVQDGGEGLPPNFTELTGRDYGWRKVGDAIVITNKNATNITGATVFVTIMYEE